MPEVQRIEDKPYSDGQQDIEKNPDNAVNNIAENIRNLTYQLDNGIEKSQKPLIVLMYDSKDQRFAEELKTHLASMIRQGKITVWDTTMIEAGRESEIIENNNLSKATFIIALASSDFNNNDNLISKAQAISRDRLLVVPIRPCDMALFNENNKLRQKPISKASDQDEAYCEVAEALATALAADANKRPSISQAPSSLPPHTVTPKEVEGSGNNLNLSPSENRKLQIYKTQYDEWPEPMKTQCSWNDIQKSLLKPDGRYLRLAEGLHKKGILFGVDDDDNLLFADGGDEPILTNLTYPETYNAVYFRQENGKQVKSGYEMFPYNRLTSEKSDEIVMFETFTKKPFIKKSTFSWLDSGYNPESFKFGIAQHSSNADSMTIYQHTEETIEDTYSDHSGIITIARTRKIPKNYLKQPFMGVRRLLRVPLITKISNTMN